MVLQAYGSALPSAPKNNAGRNVTMKTAAIAAMSLMALALLISSNSSMAAQPQSLEDLGDGEQHLMSQASRYATEMKADDKIFETEGSTGSTKLSAWTGDDSATFDALKDVSSRPVVDAEHSIADTIKRSHDEGHHETKHSWFQHWGKAENYFEHSHKKTKANRWEDRLKELKEKEAARRKSEDEKYFAGVEKAFGKKAGLAMMSAFDGGKGSDNAINKLKISDKKLDARKDKIAEVMHKAIALKKVVVHQGEDSKEAKAAAQNGVQEALKVAKQIAAHKDPVAHTAKKGAHEAEQQTAPKTVGKRHAKQFDVNHPGVVADGKEIKKLVHEFHHAHGKEKKILKARVMQLQQDIVKAFSAVTAYGHRAETALARAEAKEKTTKQA